MSRQWRDLVPEEVRRSGGDQIALLSFVLLTGVLVTVPAFEGSTLRVVCGLVFLLFTPGYALVSLIFPRTDRALEDGDADSGQPVRTSGITGIERVLYAIGLSLTVVLVVSMALIRTSVDLSALPLFLAISAVTGVASAGTIVRRRRLPPAQRFRLPTGRWFGRARAGVVVSPDNADTLLNVALVVSVLLLVGSFAYAVTVPKPADNYTEFYLLANDSTGELRAAEYPTEYTMGDRRPVVVGIGNNESTVINYVTVVELQRVSTPNRTSTVREETELGRFSVRLEPGERANRRFFIEPTMTGHRLRLQFLLYQQAVPEEPSADSAAHAVHLWVNVTARNETTTEAGGRNTTTNRSGDAS